MQKNSIVNYFQPNKSDEQLISEEFNPIKFDGRGRAFPLNKIREQAVDMTPNECRFFLFIKYKFTHYINLDLFNSQSILQELINLTFKEVDTLISKRENTLRIIYSIDEILKNPQKTLFNTENDIENLFEFRNFIEFDLTRRPENFENTLKPYKSLIILIKLIYKTVMNQSIRENVKILMNVTTTNALSYERIKMDNSNILSDKNFPLLDFSSPPHHFPPKKINRPYSKVFEEKIKNHFTYTDTIQKGILEEKMNHFFSKHSTKIPLYDLSSQNGFFSNMKLECSCIMRPDTALLPQNLGLGATVFELPDSFEIPQNMNYIAFLEETANLCEKNIGNHNKKINPEFDLDSSNDGSDREDEKDFAYLGSDKNCFIFLGKNTMYKGYQGNEEKKTKYYLIVQSYCELDALKLYKYSVDNKLTVEQIFKSPLYSALIQNSYKKRCALAYLFMTKVLKIEMKNIECIPNPLLNPNTFGCISTPTSNKNNLDSEPKIKYANALSNAMLSFIKETNQKDTNDKRIMIIFSNQMEDNNSMLLFINKIGEIQMITPLGTNGTIKSSTTNREISIHRHKLPTFNFKDFTDLSDIPSEIEISASSISRDFIKYINIGKNNTDEWERHDNSDHKNKLPSIDNNNPTFLEHTHTDLLFSTNQLEYNPQVRKHFAKNYFLKNGKGSNDQKNVIIISPIYYRFSTEDPASVPDSHFINYINPKKHNYFYLRFRHPLNNYLLSEVIINRYNKDQKNLVKYYPNEIDDSFPFFRRIPIAFLEYTKKFTEK